jgi:tetratricopeptide (TPR) repeat protein
VKRIFTVSAILLVLALSAAAQKIEKPKLVSQPPTAEQRDLIHQGNTLHDAKRYDEAIAKYQQVLKDNPDCTMAMFELANSLYQKKDRAQAESVARKGAQYRSSELPLFYVVIASTLDDAGKPDEAIEIYKSAAKVVKSDDQLRPYLAPVNYNLALTYNRQKQVAEMRPVLKEGIEADFSHANSHYLLAEIYIVNSYKMPALLAATRTLGLEQNTPHAKRAAAIFLEILKPAAKDGKTGNINIFVNMGAPKDEGDFGMFELFLGTITTVRGKDDEGKSEEQMFVDGVSSIFAITTEQKDLKKFFVGKYYVPYLESMKNSGHQETFAYLVLQQGGNAGGAKWVTDHPDKVTAYYHWAKEYRPALR